MTVRLRDAGQGPVTARVRLFTGLTAARGLSLTEDARGEPVPLADGAAPAVVPAAGRGHPRGHARALAGRARPRPSPPSSRAAGPPEPAQPVYARYWLHGKGPAPAGQPAGRRAPVARARGRRFIATRSLRLTVACGPDPAAGEIRLAIPPGLDVQPAGPLRYDLAGRGHAGWDLAVRARPGRPPGTTSSPPPICDQAGQQIEDAALVAVGEPAPPEPPDWLRPGLLAASDAEARAVEAEVELTVARRAAAPGAGRGGRDRGRGGQPGGQRDPRRGPADLPGRQLAVPGRLDLRLQRGARRGAPC